MMVKVLDKNFVVEESTNTRYEIDYTHFENLQNQLRSQYRNVTINVIPYFVIGNFFKATLLPNGKVELSNPPNTNNN